MNSILESPLSTYFLYHFPPPTSCTFILLPVILVPTSRTSVLAFMMSQLDGININWEPYRAEILSRYVDQNQTLESTMAYMRQKYGLCATYNPYQFHRLGKALIFQQSKAVQNRIFCASSGPTPFWYLFCED
jgi:Clr5 domain